MSWTYDQLIAELDSAYNTANIHRSGLMLEYNQAWADYTGGNDHAALQDVIQGMYETVQALASILAKGYYGWNGSTFALISALDRAEACPFITEAPEYKLTMSAILEAMFNAKPHQPLLFIGYLEAYKASVWNATFDERFFGDLVKKWSIWE